MTATRARSRSAVSPRHTSEGLVLSVNVDQASDGALARQVRRARRQPRTSPTHESAFGAGLHLNPGLDCGGCRLLEGARSMLLNVLTSGRVEGGTPRGQSA